MTHVRAPNDEDREEWRRMRRSLWPDGSDEEHDADIVAFLGGEVSPPPTSCGCIAQTCPSRPELNFTPGVNPRSGWPGRCWLYSR